MLSFTLALGLLWVLKDVNLLNSVADLSSELHFICQAHVGHSSQWKEIYSALTCGTSLYQAIFFDSLRSLGIVHLFVLSGAHLVFAERLLYFVTTDSRKIFLSLLGLSMLTGFKAPASRALMHWGAKHLSLRKELGWPSSLSAAITGILCLSINPEWWLGLSLPLSWVASLSFSLFPTSKAKSLAAVYLLGLPLLTSLGPASPIAILINILFSPVFFFLLFPLSWLAGIIPILQSYIDPLWSFCFQVLDLFKLPLHFELQSVLTQANERWAYVFSVQAVCYFKERFF